MSLLKKGYRGMAVLFDLNADLLLYVGATLLALASAAYLGNFLL